MICPAGKRVSSQEPFRVDVIIAPQLDEHGNIAGYAGYGENISKKKPGGSV